MVTFEEAHDTGVMALRQAGVSEAFAHTQMALLLEAEIRGVASHGLLRLPRVIERIQNGVTDPSAAGDLLWEGKAMGRMDGQNGLGPVIALHAVEAACDRAEVTGCATVAIRNCDHLGMLAWYAEHIAQRGFVAICLTISEALVHPWGGRNAMIGTNPIAIGVPGDPQPFVMDMATSLVSMGKIHDYANRDEPIPEGWALDASGDPTTVAADAKHGAIAPFGGPKGYALGLGFELLVTALTGSAIGTDVKGTLDSDQSCNKGDLMIAMKPDAGGVQAVAAYLDALRTSPSADPAHPVRVPGDRALENRLATLENGISPNPEIWKKIQLLAQSTQQNSESEVHHAS